MKKLLLGLLLSVNCFGNGWFDAGMSRFLENGSVRPMIGVGFNEPLVLGLSYSSWSGIGVNATDKVWATTRHDLGIELQPGAELLLGTTLRHNDLNSDMHAMIRMDLWQ